MLRRHQRHALEILGREGGEISLQPELSIPQASRFVDSLVIAGVASDIWGPIRAAVTGRLVAIEHFSRPPGVASLSWPLAKHAWLCAAWHKPGREERVLLASARAFLAGRFRPRPPLLLVLSSGRPGRALAAAGEVGLAETEPGIWRAVRPVYGDRILIDLRGLGGDQPGTSVLRLLATPRSRAEATSLLDGLLADPGVLSSRKERLMKGLSDGSIPGTEAEREHILDRTRREGRVEGRVDQARAVLLRVLERRGLPVSHADRERIAAETDLGRLDRWHDAAITAGSTAEVLGVS